MLFAIKRSGKCNCTYISSATIPFTVMQHLRDHGHYTNTKRIFLLSIMVLTVSKKSRNGLLLTAAVLLLLKTF